MWHFSAWRGLILQVHFQSTSCMAATGRDQFASGKEPFPGSPSTHAWLPHWHLLVPGVWGTGICVLRSLSSWESRSAPGSRFTHQPWPNSSCGPMAGTGHALGWLLCGRQGAPQAAWVVSLAPLEACFLLRSGSTQPFPGTQHPHCLWVSRDTPCLPCLSHGAQPLSKETLEAGGGRRCLSAVAGVLVLF